MRGAESTRRCISVAFLDVDKRCLENCRNFLPAGRGRGWQRKRVEDRRRGQEVEKKFFRYKSPTDLAEGEDAIARGEAKRVSLPDRTLTHMENIEENARKLTP